MPERIRPERPTQNCIVALVACPAADGGVDYRYLGSCHQPNRDYSIDWMTFSSRTSPVYPQTIAEFEK